jgi:cytoskeletal protein CcmA (bactofilin family)
MSRKIAISLILVAVLTLTVVVPVAAFDGRTGQDVVIAAGDTINNDLYVAAANFTLDGTVNGDLIVTGSRITINGTVNGSLMAAGQTVIINGQVTGSARIAGAALYIGENASIGHDMVAAGASLEARPGSSVGRDGVFAGGQALFSGDLTGNLLFAGGGLDLRGKVGGNVKAAVGEVGSGRPSPSVYMPQAGVPLPTVNAGLTVDPAARIGGTLEYTQTKDLSIPASVVGGQVTRILPAARSGAAPRPMTAAERIGSWFLNLLRSFVTLILIGLLLAWLAPKLVQALAEKVRGRPLPSLGWGVVAYAAFFFALLVLLVVVVLAGVIFGFLTLGGLAAAAVFAGLAIAGALIVAFVLVTAWLTKVTIGMLIGKLILNAARPGLGEHKIWPLLVGVPVVAVLVALPYIGWLFGVAVLFFGLGALWIWGRDALVKKA